MDNVTLHRVTGDKRYVTLDWRHKLADGQTISSVTWTPEGDVTETAATSAVSGQQTSARFETPTEGRYRVDVSLATTTPTETVKGFFILVVEDPPVV
jgi:hypothetical protein